MHEGRDVEINSRIGRALLGILPENAESITAKAIIQSDWSEVGFTYSDRAGDAQHFTHEANLDDIADEIADALDAPRMLMTEQDGAAWNRSDITVRRNGEFDANFSYEDDPLLCTEGAVRLPGG